MRTSQTTSTGQLTTEGILRIANTVTQHPRFDRLYAGLDALHAWIERAQAHYLSEIDRIGPTKARKQLRRIVNEVALIA